MELLGFTSLDEVNSDSLKRAFKRAATLAHPDKGGKEGDFELVLDAYLQLAEMLKRTTGGRDGLAVLDAKEVQRAREEQFTRELNNMMNDVLDQVGSDSLAAFHAAFESLHVSENTDGYAEWLQAGPADMEVERVEESEFHTRFEAKARDGVVPTTLILQPDEMAYSYGKGTELIPSKGAYHSAEFCDLHAAYTSENLILPQLPVFTERSLDELLAEREKVYDALADTELAAIADYEKKQQQRAKEHQENIKAYFRGTASSAWALKGAGLPPV